VSFTAEAPRLRDKRRVFEAGGQSLSFLSFDRRGRRGCGGETVVDSDYRGGLPFIACCEQARLCALAKLWIEARERLCPAGFPKNVRLTPRLRDSAVGPPQILFARRT
jgi:hypothetical protein